MKLAYVCADAGVPAFGTKGASVHVQEMVRALRKRGASVALLARKTGGSPPADLATVPVEAISASRPTGCTERDALRMNTAFRRHLEQTGPYDMVYERYSLWSFAGVEYAQEHRVPSVLEVNAPLLDEQARYRVLRDPVAARAATSRAFEAASRIFAVSEGVAEHVREHVRDPSKISVVSNGVDPARFRPGVEPSLPAPNGAFTVGFVGSLKPWHGVATLIDAFALVHAQDPHARLLIVGDGPEAPSIARALDERGLYKAAVCTGSVSPAAIPGFLASMDVAVAPYPDLEPFYFSPLKLYEYMAAGLPVVASRVGQIATHVHDGYDGLLVPPDDARSLATAVDRLRRSPSLRKRMGGAARLRVEQHHTWDQVADRVLREISREEQ